MCILYGDYVDLFECVLNCDAGSLSSLSPLVGESHREQDGLSYNTCEPWAL